MDIDVDKALEYLCCPYCKSALEFSSGKEGSFRCVPCKKDYPIEEGIPRFLEATEATLQTAKEHWEDSPNFQYEAHNPLYSKAYYEEQDEWRTKEIDPFSRLF